MWNRVTIEWQFYSQKRKIYMCSDISEEVVKNRYKHLGGSNWLGKPLYIIYNRSLKPALCLPAFRPPAPDMPQPLQWRPHTPHAVAARHHLDFTPLASLRLWQPHAPHANVPLWPPRPLSSHSLATRPPPSSSQRRDLTPLAPHASHTAHDTYAPCATHTHLLSSSPAPSDWPEVTRADLLKTFASGTAPELDRALLGQAGGGSSLEALWTLPALAPEDWVKWIQVEHGREDMCS